MIAGSWKGYSSFFTIVGVHCSAPCLSNSHGILMHGNNTIDRLEGFLTDFPAIGICNLLKLPLSRDGQISQ